MAKKKRRVGKQRRPNSKSLTATTKPASRSGSNAGRGFRYQDAVSACLAVEIWAGLRPPATVIPEGGDDVELRGDITTFVQIKSRREHLGNYLTSDAVRHITELWARCIGSSPRPDRLEIIFERNVTGLKPLIDKPTVLEIEGLITTQLSQLPDSDELFLKTTVTVASSPQEASISAIVDRLGCSPIAAQMCFAELLMRIGALADANGRLSPERYAGLSVSDIESAISETLSAIDIATIERAIREGVCEPLDFLTPLDDPNFYLGVDVEPGHVAAGLVSERPNSRFALVHGIEERRAALIVGPSGAGKSALMWETANSLRHSVRWFRIRRISVSDIPAVRQLIRTFRATEGSPLGFIMDDIGRNGPEAWGALLKEIMPVPGVVMLGSVREEDVTLIAERARAIEVRADPDEELAARLWRQLGEAEKTHWAGWREPWELSNGLLLEYVHILTRGRRMEELLSDQIAARVSDPERVLELDILRSGAWAGAAGAEIDASRLARVLTVTDADISRALYRLVEEHLVRSRTPGLLTGLHQLRSEKLLRLTHSVPPPTLATSFTRTVASVLAKDLEPLVADAVSQRRLHITEILEALITRLEPERDPLALAAALRGLGTGRISAGVDEWLETPEVHVLPRTQIGTAGMLGITSIDLSGLDIIPEVQAAAHRLSQIKGSPQDDPRHLLMERLSAEAISALIEAAELDSLDEILAALVDMPLSEVVRSNISKVPSDLLNAKLDLVGSVLGTLTAIDRSLACRWVEQIGQEALFNRIHTEIAWAGSVSVDIEDDGMIVSCDLWYVASSKQKNPHDDVVNLCEIILALCPAADFAKSRAITVNGEVAGLPEFPLATKRIPRENLPPPSVPQWNRRWGDLISRRVAAPSYSDYLTRGTRILDALVPMLEQIFDAHLRGKDALASLFEKLNSLKEATEALTPPAMSAYDVSGTGSSEANKAVTKFQNVLYSTAVNLVKRFALLPDQAGSYIAWLTELISDVDTAIAEEPWQLIGNDAPPTLTRLKSLLETLRALAGEANERGVAPVATWVKLGKGARAGNAVRLISVAAKVAGETRMNQRKAEIERAASNAGINATFHLRENPRGLLPWPPTDVLALLSAADAMEATVMIDRDTEPLRALVDSATSLTIMPIVDGVGLHPLARSGHQTMLPSPESGVAWLDDLGMEKLRAETADTFQEVLNLAAELGAMDRLGLGLGNRASEEISVRQALQTSFNEGQRNLEQLLADFEDEIRENVSELVTVIRTGEIDFVAEAHSALNGSTSGAIEGAGLLSVWFLEQDRRRQ